MSTQTSKLKPATANSRNRRPKPGPSQLVPASKLKVSDRDVPAPRKKLKQLTPFGKAPVFDLTGSPERDGPSFSQSQPTFVPPKSAKGKEKALPVVQTLRSHDDRLWVDDFEPMNEADLAVHKKKVGDVRSWLREAFEGGPTGKLKRYRRILALTGPAGTGKTATLRVLARELGCEILEWHNSGSDAPRKWERDQDSWNFDSDYDADQDASTDKFHAFLARASACSNIFGQPVAQPHSLPLSLSQTQSQTQSRLSTQTSLPASQSTAVSGRKRHLILLEDLPNILHAPTQTAFHAALEAFVHAPADADTAPLVIVISDAGVRGEAGHEDRRFGSAGARERDDVDVRTVLPVGLRDGPFVTQIAFNPVASTLMRRALQTIITRASASGSRSGSASAVAAAGKDVLDLIADASGGDIRAAVNALQFACVAPAPAAGAPARGKAKQKSADARRVLEAVTRREQSLALFHLLGKIFYNKRKGDPPATHQTKKDTAKEAQADQLLPGPIALPPHLRDHERRTSRVDVDVLYADSPVDSSLLSLYVHQNYTQFCDTLDECESLSECLSWIDASGGEQWYQANPHRFHLLTLGALHALPSPVPRRGQKMFKPKFFDVLKEEREAADGVRDVQAWLQKPRDGTAVGGWNMAQIATELGGVLRARDAAGLNTGVHAAPLSHRSFSALAFSAHAGGAGELAEEGDPGDGDGDVGGTQGSVGGHFGSYEELEAQAEKTDTTGGWLEGDDIEDF